MSFLFVFHFTFDTINFFLLGLITYRYMVRNSRRFLVDLDPAYAVLVMNLLILQLKYPHAGSASGAFRPSLTPIHGEIHKLRHRVNDNNNRTRPIEKAQVYLFSKEPLFRPDCKKNTWLQTHITIHYLVLPAKN